MKLVLIDDEPFHLIGMQTVIPWEQSQFIIAGEARSGEEGIELILREQPDIAIVDIVSYLGGIYAGICVSLLAIIV